MVKEGYLFAAGPFVLGGVALLLKANWAAAVLFLLAAFILYFFRDPERVVPSEPGAVVSPADGRVVVVTHEAPDGGSGKRISIFLAVWNDPGNRSPLAGRQTKLEERPGRFPAAAPAPRPAAKAQPGL